VDRLVGQMENHDAVIEAAIKEQRQAVAKAKVRLERLRREGDRLRSELAASRRETEKWTERARDSAQEKDEETALECLRRRRASQKRTVEVAEAVQRHESAEEKLGRDVGTAEKRLRDLDEQRHLMRTRQSAAEALRATGDMAPASPIDVSAAFERWSESVAEAELTSDTAEETDPLARRFEEQEERDDLKAELKALVDEKESRDER
jgi:phage shock protein A